MKHNLIFILIIPLLFASCSDDFLQRNPTKSVTDSNFFNSETELELYSNGFYSYVPGGTDLMATDFTASDNIEVSTYSAFLAGVRTVPASGGGWSWTTLRNINYFLAHYRKADIAVDRLNYYEGFAKFFRAWFYFEKIKMFGDVPWYSEPLETTSEELYKGRDSRTVVADSILVDLDRAIRYLGTAKSPTRISRWTALALKSRFCLYEGTMRKYHAVDPSTGRAWTKDESRFYLGECVKACEAIMGDGVYKLTDDPAKRQTQYRDMFTNADACGVYTDEFIWARDYDIDLKVTYAINNYMVNPQHANYAFTRQFIDTYLMTDGTPFTSKYPDYDDLDLVAECTDRDYRLAQTIRTPGFTRDGGTTQWAPDVKFSKTGYQPIKWLTDDSSKDTNVAAIASDVPLIRYAEVLLAYAEAKAELGEMSEEVWDKTIKPLRERAGVKSIYPTAADPYMVEYFQNQVTDPFILEVRRERGIELTMENSRYQDIIRWHQGELFARPWKGVWISAVDTPLDLNADGTPETIVTANPKLQSTLNILMIDGASEAGHKLSRGTSGNILPSTALERKWQDYKYVKPIPTTARQENPNLTQNPKW